mgnify:CR=1 FL=1
MKRFPIFPLRVAEVSGLADGSMLKISIGWVHDPRSKSLAVAALPKEIVGIQNDEQRFSLLLKLGYATALLHKSSDRRTSPYPGRIYGIATVTGVPS